MKRKYIKIQKKQKGYIVLITIMLLATLLTTSLSFFERAASNMQMTGYNRDSAESLLLAESAMNMLLGRYISLQDLDGDLIPDRTENVDSLAPIPPRLYYMYFTSNGLLVDQPAPSILQRVANGEARGIGNALASNLVPIANNNLRIRNLFVDVNTRPIVFNLAANNLLFINNAIQTSAAWDNAVDNNNQIAAVWFELVQNPALMGNLQIYVGSVAIVGNSRSYVQRLVGSVGTNLGNAAGLMQGI